MDGFDLGRLAGSDARTRVTEDGAHRRGFQSARYRLLWFAYVLIYPLPWLEDTPSAHDIAMSAIGLVVFAAIYGATTWRRLPLAMPVLAYLALAYLLTPYKGVWTVFITFAAGDAARGEPRIRAILMVLGILLTLPTYTVLAHGHWIDAGFGILFAGLTAIAVMARKAEAERNGELLLAQNEVRSLAATAERERIARDLHDLLGHSLTMIAIKADLAGRMMARDPARASAEINEIATAARTSLREVRAAVTGMKGASLAYELDRARAALMSAGVALHVIGDAAPIAPARDGVLAMALREAVTNVVRHARATRCTITLTHESGEIAEMIVQDNGTSGAPPMEGNGLRGMRARLAAAGGSLEVRALRPGLRITARLVPS